MTPAEQSRDFRGKVRAIKDEIFILERRARSASSEERDAINEQIAALRKEKEGLFRKQSRN